MTGVAAAESTEVYGQAPAATETRLLPRLSESPCCTLSVTPTRLLHWEAIGPYRPSILELAWCISVAAEFPEWARVGIRWMKQARGTQGPPWSLAADHVGRIAIR